MPKKIQNKEQLKADLLKWIANGETLADFCREKGIGRTTVHQWRHEDDEFNERFARARDNGYDQIADSCFRIADEMPPTDDNGRTDSGFVSWQKNRIYTRLQLLAKWDPKRYGERKILAGDEEAPLKVEAIERVIVDPKVTE
jgi:hypothetical protein